MKNSNRQQNSVSCDFPNVPRLNLLCLWLILLAGVFFFGLAGCGKNAQSSLAPQTSNTTRNASSETRFSISEVTVPSTKSNPQTILCTGAACLRLAVYLNCADRVAGVEAIEKDETQMVPYRIACPELRDLPTIGESHGRENIEAVLSLTPRPELIFRTKNTGAEIPADVLETRTGIRTAEILCGDLESNRETLFRTLRQMGEELGVEKRAEEVIQFIEKNIQELQTRCAKVPPERRPTVFLGGLSYRGAHGFNSTSANYEAFLWTCARNTAAEGLQDSLPAQQMSVAKEQILQWNPEFIFVDLGTLDAKNENGILELKNDPIYQKLEAVQSGRVFALYPNSSYYSNFDARLANAWFIGKTLYPNEFADVDLDAKIREIFTFLTGSPVLDDAAETLREKAFRQLELENRP